MIGVKLSVWDGSFPRGISRAQVFSHVADMGYDGYELRVNSRGFNPLEQSAGEYNEILKEAKSFGLELPTIAGGPCGAYLQSDSEATRRKSFVALRNSCEALSRFNGEVVLIGAPYIEMPELAKKYVLEGAKAAEEYSVKLGVEDFQRNLPAMKAFLREIDKESVGVYFDTAIAQSWGLAIPQVIEELGDLVMAFYAHTRNPATLLTAYDWPAIMRSLKKIGYDYYLTFETYPNPRKPWKAVAEARLLLDKIHRM